MFEIVKFSKSRYKQAPRICFTPFGVSKHFVNHWDLIGMNKR